MAHPSRMPPNSKSYQGTIEHAREVRGRRCHGQRELPRRGAGAGGPIQVSDRQIDLRVAARGHRLEHGGNGMRQERLWRCVGEEWAEVAEDARFESRGQLGRGKLREEFVA